MDGREKARKVLRVSQTNHFLIIAPLYAYNTAWQSSVAACTPEIESQSNRYVSRLSVLRTSSTMGIPRANTACQPIVIFSIVIECVRRWSRVSIVECRTEKFKGACVIVSYARSNNTISKRNRALKEFHFRIVFRISYRLILLDGSIGLPFLQMLRVVRERIYARCS